VTVFIRSQTPADTAAVRLVTNRAFGHHEGVDDLVDALAAGPARLSLVAQSDTGDIVGHVMLSRGWLDAERELVDVLVLSPLSVDPDFQRRGIGGRLVRAALAGAESRGAPAVFLEGWWHYYSRFGFEPGEKYGFTAPSQRIPAPAFQVVLLAPWQDWMTGQLVYPDAFWAHDSVGLRGETLRNALAQVGS
jgi:putative acetyltransferase